ncbi:polysaccharide lyase family protein [Limisphaera sp. VF-2]|uniref:polysaccharide lyase family protein n=1 Tax=Limisphaera sp. VF-2 TaxID=3400418 RepID=UPI003C15D698
MKRWARTRWTARLTRSLATGIAAAGWFIFSFSGSGESAPVTLTVTDRWFVLENGLVTARIESTSGVLVSLQYKGRELLAQQSRGGALGGYWSWVGQITVGPRREPRVRIDPTHNGGELAEVATEFLQDPARPPAAVEMSHRYALRRGEPCLYVSSVWRHRPGDPGFRVGEARYALKLHPEVFDFLSVDARRQRQMPRPEDWDRGQPTNLKEARRLVTGAHAGTVEHKYDYAARLYEIPAYGWCSTRHAVGLWIVQPGFEFIAGGPTKVELTGHLDVNPGGTPTLLHMWLGSHYGGSSLVVGTNEAWSKMIGPLVLYCNEGKDPEGLWKDALDRARDEAERWPYDWVQDPEYPPAAQRATVRGQIRLQDPLLRLDSISNLWVGLTAPDYAPPPVTFGRRGPRTVGAGLRPPVHRAAGGTNAPGLPPFGGFPPLVDWQRDAKHYQFWTRAGPDGSFELRHVRPGRYTLHAIADGVLGEFVLENVAVASGSRLELGTLIWRPTRLGRTLWEIGVPDRTAREFRHGDHYWQWGLYLRYPEEFPNDVDFEIGRSDWRVDWNYVQPPRILESPEVALGEEDEHSETASPGNGSSNAVGVKVLPTTWTIRFQLSETPRGRAFLRMAFCGAGPGCRIEVAVNGEPVGDTGWLPPTSTMHRDGIEGYWTERRIAFDAGLLRVGENRITLHLPARSWTQGVLYDYLRLELDEPGDTRAGSPAEGTRPLR